MWQRNVPLAPLTSFRVGGKARYFAQVDNLQTLREAAAFANDRGLPVFILGKGTNVLVADSGFPGLVIRLGPGFSRLRVDGNLIVAGGSALLFAAVREALNHSLAGLEWAAGIPGTVGGAVKMNAGAFGLDLSRVFSEARIYDLRREEMRPLFLRDLRPAYRKTALSDTEVVLEAVLRLAPGEPEKIKARMESIFAERKRKQPIGQRSAGSVFKNPGETPAAVLIERAGLKGMRIGGAMVSEKHANFIINTGSATAADIYNLIKKIQEEVYTKFGVKLETEVILVGEFP